MHKDSSRAGTIISRRSCSSNVDISAIRRPISRELIRSYKSFDIPGVHHSTLRLLGARPPPLIRRSSFPTPQAKKTATSSLCGTPSKGLTRRQSAESEEEIRIQNHSLHIEEFMKLSKLSTAYNHAIIRKTITNIHQSIKFLVSTLVTKLTGYTSSTIRINFQDQKLSRELRWKAELLQHMPGLTCFNKQLLSVEDNMEKSDKREIPITLRKALAVDAYLTDEFVKLVEKILPLRQLKVHNKLLEISCHGIPWLTISLISIWIFNVKSLYQMQMNLLIGLLFDIIVVAVLKAVTRRRRPTSNDDPFSLGPDKYSFPSGHSSRSAFVVYFFFNLWPISLIYSPPLLAWSFSVCMSRLLMRRHYILDVFGGILLGIFEGLLIGYIYLEQETCIHKKVSLPNHYHNRLEFDSLASSIQKAGFSTAFTLSDPGTSPSPFQET
ncbi:Presqualene diphosphate phosphatase [Atta colombica]|uniref:Presqualene diphosphate phosphatase n=1 Tax=Atta colombica TaxID=520822 RepID=A0A195BDN9_9HYME|nr:Presqualene diphosphate phosphatase [Atta colombica]